NNGVAHCGRARKTHRDRRRLRGLNGLARRAGSPPPVRSTHRGGWFGRNPSTGDSCWIPRMMKAPLAALALFLVSLTACSGTLLDRGSSPTEGPPTTVSASAEP